MSKSRLVRNGCAEWLKEKGDPRVCKRGASDEILSLLKEKMYEEIDELFDPESQVEEVCDVIEVALEYASRRFDLTRLQLIALTNQKARERGTFSEGFLLPGRDTE